MAGVRVLVMVHRRGTGRGRSGNGKPRVCLSGRGLLVDDGERWRGSWRGRATRRHQRVASQIGRLKTMSSSVGPACQCIPNRYVRLGFDGFSGWAAVVGFGPGKLLPFFCFDSFSFSSVFYLLIWIQTYLQDFEFGLLKK
jgi:hypothetical protein